MTSMVVARVRVVGSVVLMQFDLLRENIGEHWHFNLGAWHIMHETKGCFFLAFLNILFNSLVVTLQKSSLCISSPIVRQPVNRLLMCFV
mmetsp:Transcript_88219/g.234590  ORF Transcript_88219/g.234590 Transcript_88219/m.234590 type:complete len:89 (-) Transcript_88219:35-301(-)